MDNLIHIEDTFESLLSKEHYFQSLLQVLHSNNLLTAREIERIQIQLVNILTETVGYYTKNGSSSVKVDVAEKLMLSICYTIGLFLKNQPTIKESIASMKKTEIKNIFAEGEKLLKAKVDECQRLLDTAKETRLLTENYAYIDSIYYGIPLFFKDYDIRFASHETPGSIDYPLAVDVIQFVGIEYIEEYLKKVIIENQFCLQFGSAEIEALLNGFNMQCNHMLINIFQHVLTNCLGCILTGKGVKSLDITNGDRVYLKNTMENLSQTEVESLLFLAAEKLCQELSIEDKNMIEYINKSVYRIAPEIKRCVDTNTLENIFITLSKSEKNMLTYEDGKSLDNSRFRSITEEIRDCSKVEDKLEIIREEFHSLKDLVDVLGADCIFGDEFIDIFKSLDDFEIALLMKNISNDKEIDTDYGTESEKEWHEKLKVYLESLDDIKKGEILRISQETAIISTNWLSETLM